MFPDAVIDLFVDWGAISPQDSDRDKVKNYWKGLAPDSPEWQQDFIPAVQESGIMSELVVAHGIDNPAYWESILTDPANEDWQNFADAVAADQQADTSTTIGDASISDAPIVVDDTPIFSGGQLLVVNDFNDTGQIVSTEYHLAYDIGTAGSPFYVTYSIGNQADFDDTFPSGLIDLNRMTFTTAEWQNSEFFGNQVGDIDEMGESAHSGESLKKIITEELALLGLEDIPRWLQDDTTAMLAVLNSSNEGWSPRRLMQELHGTAGFQARFPGFDAFMASTQSDTMIGAVESYLNEEASLQEALRRYRGPSTDISTTYVGELLAKGWTGTEAEQLLRAEQQFNDNPGALDDLNAILASRGLDGITEQDFLEVLRENEDAVPGEVYDAINDALFLSELEEQGINVDNLLTESFGTDVAEVIKGPGAFDQLARDIAVELSRNRIDLGRFGLTSDDLIRGLASNQGETFSLLAKLARERQEAARGHSQFTSNIDQRSRLRIAGLGSI